VECFKLTVFFDRDPRVRSAVTAALAILESVEIDSALATARESDEELRFVIPVFRRDELNSPLREIALDDIVGKTTRLCAAFPTARWATTSAQIIPPARAFKSAIIAPECDSCSGLFVMDSENGNSSHFQCAYDLVLRPAFLLRDTSVGALGTTVASGDMAIAGRPLMPAAQTSAIYLLLNAFVIRPEFYAAFCKFRADVVG